MNLQDQLNAINYHPARAQRRQAQRAVRTEAVYQHIPGLVADHTRGRSAAVQWNMSRRNDLQGMGAPIGSQHPGTAAVLAVKAALAEFDLPPYDMRVAGTHRAAGHGGHNMSDGRVTVEVTLHNLSGPNHVVDVPVQVRSGRLLDPGVLLDNGSRRVMTQHTFDDIIARGSFQAPVQDRQHMYARPGDNWREPKQYMQITRVGPYSLGQAPGRALRASAADAASALVSQGHKRAALTAMVRTGMTGVWHAPEVHTAQDTGGETGGGGEASPAYYLDDAERAQPEIMLGDAVKLRRGLQVPARDGLLYDLPKGMEGEVARDLDGTGAHLYVYFPELGFHAALPASALSRA